VLQLAEYPTIVAEWIANIDLLILVQSKGDQVQVPTLRHFEEILLD